MSMEKNLKEILDEILNEVEQELEEATTTGDVGGYNTPFAFGANRKKDKKKEKETATQAGYTIAESVNEGRVEKEVLQKISKFETLLGYITNDDQYKPLVSKVKKELDKLKKQIKKNESVNEDTKKRFDVDFYKSNSDRQTSHEQIIRGDKFSDVVEEAQKILRAKKYEYAEFYYKDKFLGSIHRGIHKFKPGRDYKSSPISVFESVNEAKQKRPVNRWLELKNDDTMHPHKKMAQGLKELKYQLAETEKFFRWYGKIKSMNELDSQNYWKRTNKHIYKIKERLINIAKTLKEIEQ